jgi:hypothetical protein
MPATPATRYGLPAIEGLGFALAGFLGAEALFAPAASGLPLEATLGPAVAIGIGVVGYRVLEMSDERAGQDESMLEPDDQPSGPDQPASDPDVDESASTSGEGERKPDVPPGGGLRPTTPG